jgi:mRNA interferase MazF
MHAFSSVGKIYPFEVFIPRGMANMPGDAKSKANQIRTVDKNRIKSLIGTLPDTTLKEIEKAVKIHLDFK